MDIKIFSDNDVNWGYLSVVAIVICLTVLFWKLSVDYTKRIDYLTSRGYEQVSLPGQEVVAWNKWNKLNP